MMFSPGCCCGCKMDLEFISYEPVTNVNADGEVLVTVLPAIKGISNFHVVPEHHTSDTAEWWTMTIPGISVPDGTYAFHIDEDGDGDAQLFTRTIVDCAEAPIPTCFFCTSLPGTLYYTKGTPQTGATAAYRQDTVLTYRQVPAVYRPFVQLGNAPRWCSPELTHPLGFQYILYLKCGPRDSGNNQPWLLTCDRPGMFGSIQGNLVSWDAGPPNTCDPVAWTQSTLFGSYAGTITE